MINIEQIIDRLRNQSPLLGRNARVYIADVLEALFTSHISRHGVCLTGENAIEKVVTRVTPEFDHPQRGTKISIVFENGNTVESPTLRIGATEARPILNLSNWPAGATVLFVFDGEGWRMVDNKKTSIIDPLMDSNNGASIGTDNGQYANADHVHPTNTQHDTSHIITGRFIQSRMPTSEVPNRVLAVEDANTDPAYVQVNNEMIADDAVRTVHILDNNVTTEKIADDAVRTRHILANNVTTEKIADDAVRTRHILENNVTTEKIADDAVRTRHILENNVTTEKIADDAVRTRHILDENVTTEKIAEDAVRTRHILDENVTTEKIAEDAVRTRHILDENVTTEKIAEDAVRTRHILDENVTTEKIADDAVRTRHILDENVTTEKIAEDAVRTRHILDENVTTEKIAEDAVRTRHILDENVTSEKLADNAVRTNHILDGSITSEKLADNSVNTNHIIDGSVTVDKFAENSISTNHIIDGSVTSEKLADNSVRTNHILDESVTSEKLADNSVRTNHILDENVTTSKIEKRAVTGKKLFTSEYSNKVLRVGEAGSDPVYGRVNLTTDIEDVLPVENGGTGARAPGNARINLGAASEVNFKNHVSNHTAHGRHEVKTYGPYNAHTGTIQITFDENKRLTLTGGGSFAAHDDITGFRITSWATQRRATVTTSTTNSFSTSSLSIRSDVGYQAGQSGFKEGHLFYHRDRSLYKYIILSWPNNSNTATTVPGTGIRLQNVIIQVEKLLPVPEGSIYDYSGDVEMLPPLDESEYPEETEITETTEETIEETEE